MVSVNNGHFDDGQGPFWSYNGHVSNEVMVMLVIRLTSISGYSGNFRQE